jgi:hypothetical protein
MRQYLKVVARYVWYAMNVVGAIGYPIAAFVITCRGLRRESIIDTVKVTFIVIFLLATGAAAWIELAKLRKRRRTDGYVKEKTREAGEP